MTKSRISYYDSLRGIAILAVVFIHSLKYSNSEFLDVSIFFRQIINFAVPLFLAISGYFLVSKKIETREEYMLFLKKQIPRVYIPYLVWSCFFFIAYVFVLKSHTVFEMLRNILIFQSVSIFYFVALIIQFYILLPFIQKYLKISVVASIIISLIISVLLAWYKYNFQSTLPFIVYAGNFLTWMMFFVLGMFLGKHKVRIKNYILMCGVLLFLFFSILETYFYIELFNDIGEAVTAIKFSSFIYSGLLILLLLNNKRNWTLFSDLGKVSYAVFLMHMLVLPIVRMFVNLIYRTESGFFIDLLCGIITTIICYVTCVVLRRLRPAFSQLYLGV